MINIINYIIVAFSLLIMSGRDKFLKKYGIDKLYEKQNNILEKHQTLIKNIKYIEDMKNVSSLNDDKCTIFYEKINTEYSNIELAIEYMQEALDIVNRNNVKDINIMFNTSEFIIDYATNIINYSINRIKYYKSRKLFTKTHTTNYQEPFLDYGDDCLEAYPIHKTNIYNSNGILYDDKIRSEYLQNKRTEIKDTKKERKNEYINNVDFLRARKSFNAIKS